MQTSLLLVPHTPNNPYTFQWMNLFWENTCIHSCPNLFCLLKQYMFTSVADWIIFMSTISYKLLMELWKWTYSFQRHTGGTGLAISNIISRAWRCGNRCENTGCYRSLSAKYHNMISATVLEKRRFWSHPILYRGYRFIGNGPRHE